MDVKTLVSLGPHLVTQLVKHVKYGQDLECQAWLRRVSLPSDKAQPAGCLKRLASGLLQWDAGNQ